MSRLYFVTGLVFAGLSITEHTHAATVSPTLTRYGTPGADTINGTQINDIIFGRAGNDVIRGLAGSDTLWGELGNDRLDGGTGRDYLYGGDGNDTVIGGDGNDFLSGGNGADLLFGDRGDDTLDGGLGADQMHGGAGVDVIYSNDVDNVTDLLYGDDDHDEIYGRGRTNWRPGMGWGAAVGADEVHGGNGNDLLVLHDSGVIAYGDAGNDDIEMIGGAGKLTGGDGIDRFGLDYQVWVVEEHPLYVTITDFRSGLESLNIRIVNAAGQQSNSTDAIIARFDRNHDGHISAAGDGMEQHAGLDSAIFRTDAQGRISGLELRVSADSNDAHTSQVFLAGVSDFYLPPR